MIDKAHGGNIREYLQGTLLFDSALIDFSANINPLGLSSKARLTITKNINGLVHYPEPDSKSLKESLAHFYNIDDRNILVGNGSIELVYLIPKAAKANKILIITPTFSEYEFAARANGSEIAFFPTEEGDNFKIGLHNLGQLLPRVDLVFLCNPNNPTGSYLLLEEMLFLVKLCQEYGTLLVLDEVFMDFVRPFDKDALVNLAIRNKRLILLRSLTKFFALPGLRIGYAICHCEWVKRVSSLQYPWNLNSLAQAAGREVLKDKEYVYKSREYVIKEKEYLFDRLKDIKGLKVFSPSSNFILCKLEDCAIKSAEILNEKLIKKRMIVRNCSNFRGLNEKFFRVAVRKRAENLRLITTLREVL